MPKFIFKLQTLLKVKTQIEDNLKNDLGKAIHKLEDEKAKLWRLEFEKNRSIMDFNEKSRKTTVDNLIRFNNYISFLAEKILNQKENINLASRNVDKIREELIKTVKEREILDKLKEKKHDVFQKEQLKDEQRSNDEVISFRQVRRHTGEENA
ncbi:MAG: flagellar export protein FliJ [Ruminiclostridium sp.]|nr:flagellar export protein FliJ [Ruminiclostridium sp.]